MFTPKSQAQALADLDYVGDERERLTKRYETGGSAVQGEAARALAENFRAEAGIWDQVPALFRGWRPAARLMSKSATKSAYWTEHLAGQWDAIAERHEEEAARISRLASPFFDSTTVDAPLKVVR